MKQNMGTLIKNIVSKTAVIILTSKLHMETDQVFLKVHLKYLPSTIEDICTKKVKDLAAMLCISITL